MRKKKHLKIAVIVFGIIFLILVGLIIFLNFHNKKQKKDVEYFPLDIRDKNSLKGTKEIIRGNISKKQVIFTFDGGSGSDSLPQILEVLKKHNVKGTFFLTGKFVSANSEAVKKIVSEGHEIFNHTYDHPYLTTLSDEKITEELVKFEKKLEEVAGISPKPYFRAPYGDRNDRVREVALKSGYQSVFWTEDAFDWKESLGETQSQVKERILSNLSPGNIYLMHLGDKITGKILDEIFSKIEEQGYKIVSLTQGI